MNMFWGLRLKNTNHLYGWVRFDICALCKENLLKNSWCTTSTRKVQANTQKRLLAQSSAKHQCPQTCYGPFANVPETDRISPSERKQGEKSLKLQVWMQKKKKRGNSSRTNTRFSSVLPSHVCSTLHSLVSPSMQLEFKSETKLHHTKLMGIIIIT